ncbi:hypothetical protein OH492_25120 [Vibrio chagasii]|nr:hypothetical protein [Vibrio chagasii]
MINEKFNDALVTGTGDGVDGAADGRYQLEHGRTLTISDDDAGEGPSYGANRHGRPIRHGPWPDRHRWRGTYSE